MLVEIEGDLGATLNLREAGAARGWGLALTPAVGLEAVRTSALDQGMPAVYVTSSPHKILPSTPAMGDGTLMNGLGCICICWWTAENENGGGGVWATGTGVGHPELCAAIPVQIGMGWNRPKRAMHTMRERGYWRPKGAAWTKGVGEVPLTLGTNF